MALSSCQMSRKILFASILTASPSVACSMCDLNKSHRQRLLSGVGCGIPARPPAWWAASLVSQPSLQWRGTGGSCLEASFSFPSWGVQMSSPSTSGGRKKQMHLAELHHEPLTHSLASEAEDKYSHFLALPRLTQLWSPHQQLLQMLLLPSLSTSSTQKPNVFLERSRERRWVCYGKPSVVVLKQSLEIFLWQGELAELLASGEAAKRRENPKGWLDLLPLVPNSLTGLPQAAVPTVADNGL